MRCRAGDAIVDVDGASDAAEHGYDDPHAQSRPPLRDDFPGLWGLHAKQGGVTPPEPSRPLPSRLGHAPRARHLFRGVNGQSIPQELRGAYAGGGGGGGGGTRASTSSPRPPRARSTRSSASSTRRATSSRRPTSTASSPPRARSRSRTASSSHDEPLERTRRGRAARPAAAGHQDRPRGAREQRHRLVPLRARKKPVRQGRRSRSAPAPAGRAGRGRHGLAKPDRGKLIMACGTGKTFTSLKIAEDLAGAGKRVLFLVPSLACSRRRSPSGRRRARRRSASFAVCSDSDVGKRREKDRRRRPDVRPRAPVPGDDRRQRASRRR